MNPAKPLMSGFKRLNLINEKYIVINSGTIIHRNNAITDGACNSASSMLGLSAATGAAIGAATGGWVATLIGFSQSAIGSRSGAGEYGGKASVALKRLNGHKYFQYGSMPKGSRSFIFSYAARWRSSGAPISSHRGRPL